MEGMLKARILYTFALRTQSLISHRDVLELGDSVTSFAGNF